MIVRPITISELPQLNGLATQFYAASEHLRGFDIDRFVGIWAAIIERGSGIVFGMFDSEGFIRGALGGIESFDLYSGEPYATEMFWFVDPEHRKGTGPMRLYVDFQTWARKRGNKRIMMIHLSDSMPEVLASMYERMGFKPVEVHYSKEL